MPKLDTQTLNVSDFEKLMSLTRRGVHEATQKCPYVLKKRRFEDFQFVFYFWAGQIGYEIETAILYPCILFVASSFQAQIGYTNFENFRL